MYQTIPVRYLDAWLEQGYTGRLIDLRTPEEYNVSHLCEAENIPFLWLCLIIKCGATKMNVRFCFTVRGGVKAFWCAAGMTGWDMRFIIWAAVIAFIRGSISAA
mgnify:CR=1 FL=1